VIVSSYHFLLGPLVAAVALGLIVLMCRWVFSTSSRDQRVAQQRARAQAAGDYGLLVPVAVVRTQEDADLLREVLRAAGIRGTVAASTGGGLAVLVFAADAARASSLVSR
jgi:hypothetical protein